MHSLLFSGAVTNNDPLLQLQLQSAGSLHVAFRNLRELQRWGRAVGGHFLQKIWCGFAIFAVLCDVWTCIVKFRFSKPRVAVKVTQRCSRGEWDLGLKLWMWRSCGSAFPCLASLQEWKQVWCRWACLSQVTLSYVLLWNLYVIRSVT